MAESSRAKTAFVSHCSLSHCGQFLVLPFRLCNAPTTGITADLTFKLTKCQFCSKEFIFLGYRVCPDGILLDQGKVNTVLNFETPVNVRQVRPYLDLLGYYRRFIQDYARLAGLLFTLTINDSLFSWNTACQESFEHLNQKLTTAPVLSFPDLTLPSDIGLGAALMQKDVQGREVVVAFASRALHKSKRPYSTPEKVGLAVIWALEHFCPYFGPAHHNFY